MEGTPDQKSGQIVPFLASMQEILAGKSGNIGPEVRSSRIGIRTSLREHD